AVAHPDAYTYTYTYTYTNTHAYAYTDTDADADADTYAGSVSRRRAGSGSGGGRQRGGQLDHAERQHCGSDHRWSSARPGGQGVREEQAEQPCNRFIR